MPDPMHTDACLSFPAVIDAAGTAAIAVSRDEVAFARAKAELRELLQAHERAHRSCPSADTHWPTGQAKGKVEP